MALPAMTINVQHRTKGPIQHLVAVLWLLALACSGWNVGVCVGHDVQKWNASVCASHDMPGWAVSPDAGSPARFSGHDGGPCAEAVR
jgi:hypothetical protein